MAVVLPTSSATIMEAREEEGNAKAPPLSDTTTAKVAVSKPAKSRRKISMPWFRQSSFGMTIAKLRLPRQHTIAAPDPLVELNADEVSSSHKKSQVFEECSQTNCMFWCLPQRKPQQSSSQIECSNIDLA